MERTKYAVNVDRDKAGEIIRIQQMDGASLVERHQSTSDPFKEELIFERKEKRQGLMG